MFLLSEILLAYRLRAGESSATINKILLVASIILFSQTALALMPSNLMWTPFSFPDRYERDQMSAAQVECTFIIADRNRNNPFWDEEHGIRQEFRQTSCAPAGSPVEFPPESTGFSYTLWRQEFRLDYEIHRDGGNVTSSYIPTYVFGRPPDYISLLTNVSAAPQMCAGNPIDITTGAKIQAEAENLGIADLPFIINYNNINPQISPAWSHHFQNRIQPLNLNNNQQVRAKSSAYNTQALACTAGWNDIKGQINQPWTQTAVASYSCGICEVKVGDKRMATLAIVVAATPYESMGASTQEAVRLKRSNGSESTYIHVESCDKNEWRSIDGDTQDILRTDANGNFVLSLGGGVVETYNILGQLRFITANNGHTQTLSYDSSTGNLTKVTGTSGHQLDLGYIDNRLRSITVDNNKTTRFTYGGNDLINTVLRPDTTTRQYHYEDIRFSKALTGITDERGIRYATWKYDAQGRAISSEHAGGAEKTTLAFNADGTTTVTNPLGKKTTYLFDDILGVKRVKKVTGEPTANCVGANQDYTYTPEGFIDTQTDWKGNITKFGYDSFGRQILRTQAFGTTDASTTETCWHPTLNQPSRLIEPSKITLYDYWPNGQLKSQATKPRPAGAVDCATAL